MATYFITGTSRGVGLELATQLASQPATAVSCIIISSRVETDAIRSLVARSDAAEEHDHGPRVRWVQLDVSTPESPPRAAEEVARLLGDKGLDVLVNNAAVANHVPLLKADDLGDVLNVNVVGAHRVTRAFLPLLRKGTGKKVANISSVVGSIGLSWEFPFSVTYLVSKTALNMLTVQYAKSLKDEGFTFVAVHPGWVQTDMGGSSATLTVQESGKGLVNLISSTTSADNGKFLSIHVPGKEHIDYCKGGELPW